MSLKNFAFEQAHQSLLINQFSVFIRNVLIHSFTDCADSFLLSEGIPDTELNYACGNIDDPSTSKTCTRCGRRTERRVRCRRVGACPPDCVVIREVCRVENIEAFRDDLYFPILADADVSRDAEIIVQSRITPERIAPDAEGTIRSGLAIAVRIRSRRDVVEHTRTTSCDWRQADIPEHLSQ